MWAYSPLPAGGQSDAAAPAADLPSVAASPQLRRLSTSLAVVAAAAVFGPPVTAGAAPVADPVLLQPAASPTPYARRVLSSGAFAPFAADAAVPDASFPLGASSPAPFAPRRPPSGHVFAPWLVDGPSGTDLAGPVYLAAPARRPRLPASLAVAPASADAAGVADPLVHAAATPLPAVRRAPSSAAYAPPGHADAAALLVAASPAPAPSRPPVGRVAAPAEADASAPSDWYMVAASPMPWRPRTRLAALGAFAPIAAGDAPAVQAQAAEHWLGRTWLEHGQRYRGAIDPTGYMGSVAPGSWLGRAEFGATQVYRGQLAVTVYTGGLAETSYHGVIVATDYAGQLVQEGGDQIFSLIVGDRSPSLTATLKNAETGSAVDLSTASSCSFKWKLGESGSVTTESATIVTAASGIVRYDWSASSTASAGTLYCRFVATFPTSLPQTFPSDGTWLEIPVHAAT